MWEWIKDIFIRLYTGNLNKRQCIICFDFVGEEENCSIVKYTHAGGEDVGYICESCSEYVEDNSMDSFDL